MNDVNEPAFRPAKKKGIRPAFGHPGIILKLN